MADLPRRVSIRDVARAAGVSVTTVSHALSGARSVRPATKEHVLEVVERLGYRADPMARGLRGQRSQVVGLVGDRVITTPHASAMVAGAQRAAAARGSFVAAVDSGDDPDVEALQIGEMTDRRVDGVLYARMGHRAVEIPAGLRGMPLVLLDASADDPSVSSIVPDEHDIAVTAVRHLVEHGHRRIALVTTREETLAVSGRGAGYREELARSGIEVDESLVVTAPTASAEGARRSAPTLFERPDPPTAVFCFNDQMAMGIYQAAARAGLRIPDDLSVIGVDNLPLVAEALDPGLTTVEVPHFAMGQWAANRLLDLIEHPDETPVEQVQVRCGIVARGSVAAPSR